MLSSEFCLQSILLLLFISWAVIMLAIIKTMSHFRRFDAFKERNDTELNIIAGYMKKIHEQMLVITSELKRSNRLMATFTGGNRPDAGNINYVDDGIYRDLRHEDMKIEHNGASSETQPISEKAPEKK